MQICLFVQLGQIFSVSGELEDNEQTPEQVEKDGVTEDEMEDDLFKEDYKFAEDQIDNVSDSNYHALYHQILFL